MQTERVGLEDWFVELTVVDLPDGSRTLELEFERSEDESPGPSSVSIQVSSDHGVQMHTLRPSRSVVASGGQRCEQCWYELPETLEL